MLDSLNDIPWDALMKALAVVMQVGLILAPVFLAFLRKDKRALEMLLEALPSIYDAVEQERRKGQLKTAPLERANELARNVAGRKLKPRETALVESRLKSIHEHRHHGLLG